jgi:large subunit ribosomal protein L29
MLKATDLRERTLADLHELEKTLKHDVFQNRFKNFTNRLDDTSSIKKAKKDLARVKTILTERSKALTPVAITAETSAAPVASDATATDEAAEVKPKAKKAPKAEAKASEAPAKAAKADQATKSAAAPAKKTATKKTAKKSEAE